MKHPVYRITAFDIVAPFVLDVRFDDETEQRIDFRPVLHGELYGPLRDATLFARVRIDPVARTLSWPNGADFDPATLHDWPHAGRRMAALARGWAAEGKNSAGPVPHNSSPFPRIIGIDCATENANVGLALAIGNNQGLRLERAAVCSVARPAASIVSGWLLESSHAALLALDAPLGWPRPLATTLISHTAGAPIDTSPNDMFRRETDRFIRAELRKQSLDVGADRIARTAHAALRLLATLRATLRIAIPLAWEPSDVTHHAAIEVYPAATLTAHGMPSTGYKGAGHTSQRRELLAALRTRMTIESNHRIPDLSANDNLLDAAVCALAGWDFITGRAAPPPDRPRVEHEGWIWALSRHS